MLNEIRIKNYKNIKDMAISFNRKIIYFFSAPDEHSDEKPCYSVVFEALEFLGLSPLLSKTKKEQVALKNFLENNEIDIKQFDIPLIFEINFDNGRFETVIVGLEKKKLSCHLPDELEKIISELKNFVFLKNAENTYKTLELCAKNKEKIIFIDNIEELFDSSLFSNVIPLLDLSDATFLIGSNGEFPLPFTKTLIIQENETTGIETFPFWSDSMEKLFISLNQNKLFSYKNFPYEITVLNLWKNLKCLL